ncbi:MULTISPECIES: tail fiber assembly protein [Pseudomonas]|uniref:tail fiber assembly protein n=1 Tax=Pseudomonas TaxID=286 RepID=UPI001E45D4C1|nr:MULTISPECIES: tail fiber assembly protein [Pseudomonas]MCE1114165.1 tail fiber assembly protein [Pseudomonas sp. NMI795_08]
MTDEINNGAAAPWWQHTSVIAPTVCNVHPDSGEFLGTSAADPSPLEPGVWLLAAHSYPIQPPNIKPGFAAVAAQGGSRWALVADHRGAPVYRTDNGEAITWTSLGELPEGLTLQAPPLRFAIWQDGQWGIDEAARHEALRLASARKQSLLVRYATLRIATLQDAVALDMASADEAATLTAWKRYRVELNRLDVSAQATAADAWPTSPDEAAANDWLTAQGFEQADLS